MPLISISVVLSLWTLFLLFFYSCTIATYAPFLLQTLFFSTHINTLRMYQYSLSLILKLFLSYSFVLMSQSLNLIITTNLPLTSAPMPNPSYAELSCIFDSLTLHLVFTHLMHSRVSNSNTTPHFSTPCYGTSQLNSIPFTPELTLPLLTSQT